MAVKQCLGCMQEVLRIDKQQGLIALGRFKSCVRTSLLLCGGYECQEKEGTFMIAFPQPRAAVEWALTLQLALLRYALLDSTHRTDGGWREVQSDGMDSNL